MSTNTPDPAQDIRAIEQLKYRYARALDTQDWTLMGQCVTEDFHGWYSNGTYTMDGRENLLEFFRVGMNPSVFSSHIMLHPEITLTSPTTATGVWRLQDLVHFTRPNPTAKLGIQGGEKLEGVGYYYDDYVKVDGTWLIKSSGYVRIFESVVRPDYAGGRLTTEVLHGRRA